MPFTYGGSGGVSSVGLSTTAQDLVVAGSPLSGSGGTITLNKVAEFSNGSATTSLAIDFSNGSKQRVTLTSGRPVVLPTTVRYPHGIGTPWTVSGFTNAPCVVTFSNPVDGSRYVLRFIQGDTSIVDEVILDYSNSIYTVYSFQTFDPNARNTAFSSNFPNNVADYISVPYNSAFAFGSGGFTVSTWVYCKNIGTPSAQAVIECCSPSGNSPGFIWRMGLDTGTKMGLYVANSGATSFTADDNTALVVNTWTHVAATYDGVTTVKFYQNGALTVTRTVTQCAVSAANAALFIGVDGANAPPTHPWNGYLRDGALYNTALSSGNVALLYNSGRPPDLVNATSVAGFVANLVAWWKLGDGDTTSSWADASGNSHTGTTTGTLTIINAYPNP